MNQLILGDNLEILKNIPSETVDLIYLDPPFFSNRTYEVVWGDAGEVRSFEDRFSGGIDHYIAWLKERVMEMHRILKPTGSIFLHCDWHADAYIRVEILDKIFSYNNFRGQIIWQRHNAHNDAKKKLAVLTDTIWYFSKSVKNTYNPLYTEHDESYKESFYKADDKDGRGFYSLGDMASPNPRANLMYDWQGFKFPDKGWRFELTTMQKLHDEGRIYYPTHQNGDYDFSKRPRIKKYLDEQAGALVGNIWTDVKSVQSGSKERIGYPTQKPEALLARIINMASNEGDVVLDPFVGGGTTVAIADKLQRQWIGIDQSVAAVKVSELRLNMQQDLFAKPFTVTLHKYDYDTLRYKDAFEFETFIINQYGGTAQNRKGGDKGIDGKTRENTPIQVKRSDDIGVNVIKNFFVSAKQYDAKLFEKNQSENKPVGYIIAFSFGKGAIQEVARLKNQENATILLVKVEEIIPIAKKPSLSVAVKELAKDKKSVWEIEFTASASSVAGIEFYSWDFNYKAENGFKPDVIIDKTGTQAFKFKPGIHHIACKVVDNDGLDNIEVVKLKVNGAVEKV